MKTARTFALSFLVLALAVSGCSANKSGIAQHAVAVAEDVPIVEEEVVEPIEEETTSFQRQGVAVAICTIHMGGSKTLEVRFIAGDSSAPDAGSILEMLEFQLPDGSAPYENCTGEAPGRAAFDSTFTRLAFSTSNDYPVHHVGYLTAEGVDYDLSAEMGGKFGRTIQHRFPLFLPGTDTLAYIDDTNSEIFGFANTTEGAGASEQLSKAQSHSYWKARKEDGRAFSKKIASKLPENDYSIEYATLSPDKTQIAFLASTDGVIGESSLFVVSASGGEPKLITEFGSQDRPSKFRILGWY